MKLIFPCGILQTKYVSDGVRLALLPNNSLKRKQAKEQADKIIYIQYINAFVLGAVFNIETMQNAKIKFLQLPEGKPP